MQLLPLLRLSRWLCVTVTQISSEHDITEGSEQYAWLAADLAAVDRSVTPWVVVTAHR